MTVSIAQPDKSINLSDSFPEGPCGDDQEGAYNVPIDREEQNRLWPVDSCPVDKVGVSEILPIILFQLVVDERVDVFCCDLGVCRQLTVLSVRTGLTVGH